MSGVLHIYLLFQLSRTENDLRSYTPVESEYPYFALPEVYYGNQLKSYGGYIKYVVEFGGTGSQLNIPDVILTVRNIVIFPF